jgi:hypothetical protein
MVRRREGGREKGEKEERSICQKPRERKDQGK